MCNFFSALGTKQGDVLHHPMLDHHSDLVRYFELEDSDPHRRDFAKLELVPGDNNWLDPETWEFFIDERTKPGWHDEVADTWERRMRSVAKTFILSSGTKDLVVDGCWIVGGDARVTDVRGGRIIRAQDNAQISGVRGNAQIISVRDNAQISDVWDIAQISSVKDNAQIISVGGRAQIRNVWDNAQISGVRGNAQIISVRDNAQISDVGDSAQIISVRGSRAQVSGVRDNAQIRNVWDNAQISGVEGSVSLDESARNAVLLTGR